MKFSNGCWLQKEGCACFSPAEVYFTKIEKDKVGYYVRLVNDPDAKDLFHPYFELNPTASKNNY